MIKVCIHHEYLSAGGPNHHIKNIAKYIDRTKFELYLAVRDCKHYYTDEILKYFDKDKLFIYPIGDEFLVDSNTMTYLECPKSHILYDFLEDKKIDILHDNRAGGYQFALSAPQIKCKKVETNIFAGYDPKTHIDCVMCISRGVLNHYNAQYGDISPYAKFVPLSTDFPYSDKNLREELGIREDTIVIGRSSNSYAPDLMNLEAYKQIESDKTVFIAPACGQHHLDKIKSLGIKNYRILPTITSYERMSMLYNTLDILAHDRAESFGCTIAEAMMHEVPVVSVNWSNGVYGLHNAQEELIQDPSYCAQGSSHLEKLNHYVNILNKLVKNGRDYCKSEGKIFRKRLFPIYEAPYIVKQIEEIYESIM